MSENMALICGPSLCLDASIQVSGHVRRNREDWQCCCGRDPVVIHSFRMGLEPHTRWSCSSPLAPHCSGEMSRDGNPVSTLMRTKYHDMTLGLERYREKRREEKTEEGREEKRGEEEGREEKDKGCNCSSHWKGENWKKMEVVLPGRVSHGQEEYRWMLTSDNKTKFHEVSGTTWSFSTEDIIVPHNHMSGCYGEMVNTNKYNVIDLSLWKGFIMVN